VSAGKGNQLPRCTCIWHFPQSADYSTYPYLLPSIQINRPGGQKWGRMRISCAVLQVCASYLNVQSSPKCT